MKFAAMVQPLVDAVVGRVPDQMRIDESSGDVLDAEYYVACAQERVVRISLDAGAMKPIA